MKRLDFFKEAVKAGKLKDRNWVQSAFALCILARKPEPWDIVHKVDGSNHTITFLDAEMNEVEIEDLNIEQELGAPYDFSEFTTIDPTIFPNIDKEIEVPLGNILVNWVLTIFTTGGKLPYIARRFSVREHEDIIKSKILGDKEYFALPEEEQVKYISIDEEYRFREACRFIEGLDEIVTPSGTEKAFTHHPDRDKVRAALIELHKDELTDPVVVVKIEKALEELDRAYLEGDMCMGFYLKGKSIEMVRKKLFYTIGLERAFLEDGQEGTFVPFSLIEGIRKEDLVAIHNNTREGIDARGRGTADGGYAAKVIFRATQNYLTKDVDCGTNIGSEIVINKNNKDDLIGMYMLERGVSLRLEKDYIDANIGKKITVRTISYCKQSKSNACRYCAGDNFAANPFALSSTASEFGNIMMYIKMSAMKGNKIKAQKWDPFDTVK